MKIINAILLILISAITITTAQTTIIAMDSLTRPYNITQYTANDVVNDSTFTRLLRFKNSNIVIPNDSGIVVNKGGSGFITSAMLTVGDSNNTANGNFKLLLFRDTVVNVADNAAWATAAYYQKEFIGEIDFALTNNGTVNNYSYVSNLVIPFQCKPDDRYVYGVLLAKAAYQPVRGQKVILKLGILRN